MPAPMANAARRIGRVQASDGPPEAEPGILDAIGAGWRSTRDDQTGRLDEARQAAYSGILSELTDRGYDVNRYVNPWAGQAFNYGQLRKDFDAVRQRDPKAFAGAPKSIDELEQRWRADFTARQQRDSQILQRGNAVASFVGGAAASFVDPINLGASIATGGGASLARVVAREALVNGLVSAVQQPLVAAEREKQGRELTMNEAAMNIAEGAAFGAAFPVALHGAGRATAAAGRISAPLRARVGDVVGGHIDKLSQGLRDRWNAHLLAKSDPLDDPVLFADVAEEVIGSANLTDTERAAIVAARREGVVDAANPFRVTGAGTDMHAELAAEAWRAAMDANPLAPRARVPGPSGRGAAQAMAPLRATAVATDPSGAEGRFMQRVRGAESGGNDAARNARSSATGRYQFTDGTWLAYYKRRYGASGLTDAAILAKRGEGALQDTLMSDLTRDNASALRRGGHAASEGNLYLAHFAGPEGARKVLDADPRAPIQALLGEAAVKANPFLRGKDAGWLVEWAHAKMDSVPGGRAIEVREDMPGAAGTQAAVDDALDRAQRLAAEDRAARANERSALDDALDAALAPVERVDLLEGATPLPPLAPEPEPVRSDLSPTASLDAPPLDATAADVGLVRRETSEIAATVADDATDETLLGPIFAAPEGKPGVHVEGVGGGPLGDHKLVAVFRDESGAPKAVLHFPATREGLQFDVDGGYGLGVYVDPEYRGRGIATQLYDAAARIAPWVNDMSGSGDLTPAGAGFARARRERLAVAPPSGEVRGGVLHGDQGPSGQALAELAPEARAAFLDPDNAAAKAQADSLEHDARAAVRPDDEAQADFAAPNADQRRTALERQGEGRLKAKVTQKAPGSDGGLFDVWAQDTEFRFNDEGGEASIGSLLDDLGAEEADLTAIRGCL